MTHDRDSVREEFVNYTIPFIIRHGRLVSIALALPQVVARAGEWAMEQTTDLPVSGWLQTAFEVAVLTRSVAVGARYFDAVATAVSSPHGGRVNRQATARWQRVERTPAVQMLTTLKCVVWTPSLAVADRQGRVLFGLKMVTLDRDGVLPALSQRGRHTHGSLNCDNICSAAARHRHRPQFRRLQPSLEIHIVRR